MLLLLTLNKADTFFSVVASLNIILIAEEKRVDTLEFWLKTEGTIQRITKKKKKKNNKKKKKKKKMQRIVKNQWKILEEYLFKNS